jgi:hypothetical protein
VRAVKGAGTALTAAAILVHKLEEYSKDLGGDIVHLDPSRGVGLVCDGEMNWTSFNGRSVIILSAQGRWYLGQGETAAPSGENDLVNGEGSPGDHKLVVRLGDRVAPKPT